MTINGGISFWYASERSGTPATPPRAPVTTDATADVVIVGGGYTGLWTAYYLKRAAPDLRITVLEQKFCGYGASGRNGGWLYNGIAGRDRYAALHGRPAARRLQQAMNETVTEVIDVTAKEGIDADIHRGGVLEVARTPAQLGRLKAFHAHEVAFGETDRELHDAPATRARIDIADAVGSSWSPHGARIHPLKLVKGLAAAVEALGVVIHESTPVTEIAPRRAVTPYGTVRAPYVLRCTEGFTAALKGQKRSWLPMNSSMIVTAPLPAETWSRLGWSDSTLLGDMAHAYMYAQRTADDRIAIGGRGVPYRFGSRTDNDGRTQLYHRRRPDHPPDLLLPAARGYGDHPRLVGRARRAPRLVRHRHPGPRLGPGLGGRLRGLGRRHRQPRGPHPARSGPRRIHRTDHPALGGPPGPPLGAGTLPLARRPGPLRRLPRGGPARERHPPPDDHPLARLADRISGRH